MIVLIGSGPSLNRIDVGRLAGFRSIAFNRSFLAWDDWGFAPTLYACLDPMSLSIIGTELPPIIDNNRATRFYLHRNANVLGITSSHVELCDLEPGQRFSGVVSRLTDYGNVGAISLQLLQALGYRSVLLVGVDGDYLPDTDAESDANHFRDDYARGRVPLTPELRVRYTSMWPAVAAECERLSVAVRNASPGTTLKCFETISFDDGLAWLTSPDALVDPSMHANDRKELNS
ncbi:hypothetical protein AB8B21_03015 [Tardiphaga sp. 866_E4_N2_1]|uniref:hypothetical protein n=1 Tax=unclassified Tardiphaga TaxID=2631404 RepID=UPI003F22CBE2